jgi:cobalt-zinc-cadmium efflux system outer membrane protein
MNHPLWRGGLAALFLGFLSLIPAIALAATPVGIQLTLRDAISATLSANPQLGNYRFREASIRGDTVTAGLRPPLQANAGIEDALGSGSLNGFDRTEITLSLSQVIELGDKRDARLDVAGRRLQVLQAEQRITELDLLAEVTRRFIATSAAQEQLAQQQRATQLARQTLELLEPLVSAGQTPASEQARASAALARATLAESHAGTALEAAKISLSSMWASQVPEFDSVASDLLDVGEAGNLTDLLLGLDENPDILLFASEERLLDARIREALSERRSNVQWTAGIRHLREAGDTGFVISASMPLGSRDRATGGIATAQANRAEVANRREIARNQLNAQLYGLHLLLRQAILEVQTLRDSVLPQLASALEQTRTAYLGGRYSYLELTSAQHETLDAELAVINAATTAHFLRTEIERLSGAALNSDIQETNR